MKEKMLTAEKKLDLQQRRDKEIQKLEKEKLRPRGKFYLPYLIFIISLIYLTDEVASQIGHLMKTEIANGLLSGACIGSYWGAGDLNTLMISESAPTNLRSSILSTQFFAMGIGIAFSYVVGIPLITFLGNAAIGSICFFFIVPGFIAALIVMMKKTHDTKGVELNTATGNERE